MTNLHPGLLGTEPGRGLSSFRHEGIHELWELLDCKGLGSVHRANNLLALAFDEPRHELTSDQEIIT